MRRGRPPKDEGSVRSVALGIRITPYMRESLEIARRDADTERSLNQEIELRLRRSFEMEDTITKRFGGGGTYWALQIIAENILSIEHSTGHRWSEDRFTFNQVMASIETVFDHLKPGGRASVPKRLQTAALTDSDAKTLGRRIALLSLANLELARNDPNNESGLLDMTRAQSAVVLLGRRLKGSPMREIEREWEQRKSRATKATSNKEKSK